MKIAYTIFICSFGYGGELLLIMKYTFPTKKKKKRKKGRNRLIDPIFYPCSDVDGYFSLWH